MTLSAPLGRDNADYWANLYWYNERTEELEFQQAARIARDGTAEFALDHASDYAIVHRRQEPRAGGLALQRRTGGLLGL